MADNIISEFQDFNHQQSVRSGPNKSKKVTIKNAVTPKNAQNQ